jgi:hypothetical protein
MCNAPVGDERAGGAVGDEQGATAGLHYGGIERSDPIRTPGSLPILLLDSAKSRAADDPQRLPMSGAGVGQAREDEHG